jgi:hypothetical protein
MDLPTCTLPTRLDRHTGSIRMNDDAHTSGNIHVGLHTGPCWFLLHEQEVSRQLTRKALKLPTIFSWS